MNTVFKFSPTIVDGKAAMEKNPEGHFVLAADWEVCRRMLGKRMTLRELVKVKELEWERNDLFRYWRASDGRREYKAYDNGESYVFLDDSVEHRALAADAEDGMAWCHAHYENSIYEQLEVR